jgi:RNA-directed DNA polymerase
VLEASFDAITDWCKLRSAHADAARGKRQRSSAAEFDHQLADQLIALQDELRDQNYRPGAYCNFFIREPKLRLISAAPFRDRVVHHALCNVIVPLFEARFSPQSYANRMGKGTHRAVDQVQQWAQRFRYALRGDVVQHFASLDHDILRRKLAVLLHDPKLMWLVDTVMASGEGVGSVVRLGVGASFGAGSVELGPSPPYFAGDDLFAACRPRGLPIGNLTSQFWSNVYLNDFDWFVQRELGCTAYLRYVDDFVLFGNDKRQLWAHKQAIILRLAQDRLRLHEAQMQVLPSACGIPWLGFVVYPTHRLLKRRNAVNFTRRFEANLDAFQRGAITFAELDASVQGWINHVRYADSWGLRENVFAAHPVRMPSR